jgi:hypothetical protein
MFHCALDQRTCTSVYMDGYSAPSRWGARWVGARESRVIFRIKLMAFEVVCALIELGVR